MDVFRTFAAGWRESYGCIDKDRNTQMLATVDVRISGGSAGGHEGRGPDGGTPGVKPARKRAE